MSRDTDYNSLLISTTADNYVFSEILIYHQGVVMYFKQNH